MRFLRVGTIVFISVFVRSAAGARSGIQSKALEREKEQIPEKSGDVLQTLIYMSVCTERGSEWNWNLYRNLFPLSAIFGYKNIQGVLS